MTTTTARATRSSTPAMSTRTATTETRSTTTTPTVTATRSAPIDDKISSRSDVGKHFEDASLALVLRDLRRHSGMET
eukprot:14735321-Heterocapsa_arctica.AAC.1